MTHSRKKAGSRSRDDDILRQVGEHRLTTHKVLRRLFFPGQSLNAVVKVTGRLCRSGDLRKFPFISQEAYYVLGKKMAQQLGLPPQRTEPLGSQTLPLEYAALAYATLGARLHRRLTKAELQDHCPFLPTNMLGGPVCLDDGQNPSIVELLRIDLGGPADHVARKCCRLIRKWARFDGFATLCRESRFRLVVITASSGKAKSIAAALNTNVWPDGLLIHLAVVSELVSLAARLNHGT